jgi:hypothetical protein
MVADPFFCFLEATVRRATHPSIDVKTGSLGPEDFATTRCLLPRLWHMYMVTFVGISRCDGLDMPMVVHPLRELPTLAILFCFFLANVVHFLQFWQFCATVVWPFAYCGCHSAICQWIRGQVISKYQFLHQWMLYCTDRSFETGDF